MQDNRFTLVFQMLAQAQQEQNEAEEKRVHAKRGSVRADAQPSEVDEIATLRRIVLDTTLPRVHFFTTTGA